MYGQLPELSGHKTLGIYRILQEIIENTIAHARATHLQIAIVIDNTNLVIKTKDNGVGFHFDSVLERDDVLGLKAIVMRAKLLKGQVHVNSARGGTMYVIELPLAENEWRTIKSYY